MKVEFDEFFEKEGFADRFLDQFLEKGFGVLTKAEIELIVFDCLIRNKAWGQEPSDFELANKLGISATRVRNLKDKLERRKSHNEQDTKKALRKIIEKNERWYEGSGEQMKGKVKLQIEDGYLREFAENLVRQHGGMFDTSFNRSIVTISGQVFISLIDELIEEKDQQRILKELNEIRVQISNSDLKPPIWREFVRAMAKGAGDKTGKTLVRTFFALSTDGISEVPEAMDWIKSIMDGEK